MAEVVAQVTSGTTVQGLVTIIMPFLNTRESFFLEAVESINKQTYDNWELILVDDGSEAPLSRAAMAVAGKLPEKITYVDHDGHRNLGISASRNRGISLAKGEYVAFLDADDVWNGEQLKEQVELLNHHPEVAMLYGNTTYWRTWRDNSGESERDVQYKMGLRTPQLYAPPNLLRLILQRRAISPCMTSVMVRRQVFLQGVDFEEEFREHYEDQVFLAKVFASYPVYVSNRCWGKYRQHLESVTSDGDDSDRARTWRLQYLHWLSAYLDKNKFKRTSVWFALKLELWMLQNQRVEEVTEWIRLWRRRFRKVLGISGVS